MLNVDPESRIVIRQAQAWLTQIESVQNAEHFPYLETLETIVAKARPIPVYFDVISGVSVLLSIRDTYRGKGRVVRKGFCRFSVD